MIVRPTLQRLLLLSFAGLLATACAGDTRPDAELPTDPDRGVEQVGVADGPEFARALRIHREHTPQLLEHEGVVGTGLTMDAESPRIRLYTTRRGIGNLPKSVRGIPVEPVVTGMFYAGDLNNPASRQRPAPNGFSIGHPSITAGTLGAIARDGGGVCYALSNNHVLANSNDASIGDNALQPGPFDGGSNPADAIGTLADFVPIAFKGNATNTVDAAIAELFDAAAVTASTPSYAYGAPGTSTRNATPGMSVQKFGRTTDHTTGTVEEVNVTVDVCYESRGPRCRSLARFVDQIGISDGDFSDGGDSGSLIVTNDGSKNPVGLLFAGSSTRTLANPIQDVLSTLGVAIETNTANCTNGGGDPPPNEAPRADFSSSPSGLTVQFTDESSDDDGSIDAWSWSFGDSGTSSQQNPSHTYGSAGTYSVQLTVSDDDGDTDSITKNVTVSDEPGGDFTLTAEGRKVRGRHTIDLTWSGASGSNVEIHRDGNLLTPTANDGSYTDATNNRGGATYVYQVCETGGAPCSNTASVSF